MQEAYLRWPSREDLTSLLPGGTPSRYGVPPGAQLVWDWSGDGFPLLRVDPDVPVGERYVFSLADVLAESLISALDLDRHFARWLTRLSWPLRRLVLSLSIIPVAWTAPRPDEPPSEASAMTSPTPGPLPISGGVRVVHKGNASGQQIVMSHGMVMTGPGSVAHLQALADGCAAQFKALVLPFLPNRYAYEECTVSDLSTDSAASAAAAGGGTGGSVSEIAPLSVAYVIQWRTARAGRSYRGRTYVAPVAKQHVNLDGRTLTQAGADDMLGRWTGYRTGVNGLTGTNGAALAVLSLRRGEATPVTAVTIAQVVGSQRGRLR